MKIFHRITDVKIDPPMKDRKFVDAVSKELSIPADDLLKYQLWLRPPGWKKDDYALFLYTEDEWNTIEAYPFLAYLGNFRAGGWLYAYKGNFYKTEIFLEEEDARIVFEAEVGKQKQNLIDYVERVKTRAEYEGVERLPIPEDVQVIVWNRDKGCCVKCGSQEKLEFDHIIPVSKGGSNTARNIQLLCESCNREKGARIG